MLPVAPVQATRLSAFVPSHPRSQHHPPAFPEPDAHMPRLLAPAAQQHGVAVFEKASLLAVDELDRRLSATGELDHRAGFAGPRPRYGAAAEQVAGVQAAAA